MQSDPLEEHRFYAYRVNHRARGSELLKVKLLAKVGRGGSLRGRPSPGWGERKALQRDEERHRLLDEYTRRARRDPAVAEAVSSVLASSGEPSAYASVEGVSMREEELERIMRRAGLEGEPTSLHPLAFRDRFGEVHVPLDGAEPLARAFTAAEPETVLMYLSDQESELKYRGYQAGDHYLHDLLRQYSPGWALARQWAGFEQEVEQLQKEIGRLRQLITCSAYELRDVGADQKSRRLLRALDGG